MFTIEGKKFYTTTEIAQFLDMELPSVRTLVRSGKLESVKVSKTYLIPEEAFTAYAEKRKKGRKHE